MITQNIYQYYDAFEDVQQKAVVINEYAMPYNTNLQVIICKKMKFPIETVWRLLKDYYNN